MMKKVKYVLSIVLCVCLMGCNNAFAKEEYDNAEKIAASDDRYAIELSVFNQIDGGYSLTASGFNGRRTYWTETLKEEQEVAIDFSFVLSEGQAKVVHIDADDNVTTLIECTPETCMEEYVTKTVTMKKGKNRLKVVGYDCEDLELKMLFQKKGNEP